jgi:hypothetical protein
MIPRSTWETRIIVAILLAFGLALSSVLVFAIRTTSANSGVATVTTIHASGPLPYPIGRHDAREPSGMAPPGPNALKGYVRTYTSDFSGDELPPGWSDFTGVPGGDAAGHFAATHVVVGGGMLHLNTWRDPVYANRWASGGLCQCGRPVTYGAFFVRSRITGQGPNEVELLWPANNQWPPEIDFNETGDQVSSTSHTVHFGNAHTPFSQLLLVGIDMTKWHTWGVIWTPTKITFTIDGEPWGTFTDRAAIPKIPMTLDLEQRPGCSRSQVCLKQGQSMLTDWVAEYSAVG